MCWSASYESCCVRTPLLSALASSNAWRVEFRSVASGAHVAYSCIYPGELLTTIIRAKAHVYRALCVLCTRFHPSQVWWVVGWLDVGFLQWNGMSGGRNDWHHDGDTTSKSSSTSLSSLPTSKHVVLICTANTRKRRHLHTCKPHPFAHSTCAPVPLDYTQRTYINTSNRIIESVWVSVCVRICACVLLHSAIQARIAETLSKTYLIYYT